MVRKLSLLVLFNLLLLPSIFITECIADAEIYVFRERDGTIRFTDRKPPVGVKATLFKKSKARFSIYKVGSSINLGPWTFQRSKKYSSLIEELSQQFSLDANLIKAVIHAESAFNPGAVSPKGALGLMQLMPDTARMIGIKNPFIPKENLLGGTKYLAKLIKKYDNIEHALAAYNAGEGAVDQFGGIPPYSETKSYVRKVLTLKERYKKIPR